MGTPTARNVAPAGSDYAETVRSNHCSLIRGNKYVSSGFHHMWVCLETKLLMSWLVGDVISLTPVPLSTHTEIESFQRNKMNLTWRNPSAHHWYPAKSPGTSLQCRSSGAH
ncbi:uncharacterized protein TNCV_4098211 [Trichonephila clavipes]|nr:uncharacterized protein TNCV_4098211 [Trichonephila clavipes]